MIAINVATINRLVCNDFEPGMVCCFAKATGLSATTEQAVLLLSETKGIILFVSKFTNKIVKKMMFNRSDVVDSTLKVSLLSEVWRFSVRKQKWTFRIPRRIIPLGLMQEEFLQFLRNSESHLTAK